jgi:hypothetical protein
VPLKNGSGFLVARLTLALPAAPYLSGQAFPPRTLGLPRRRVRIFAPALVPHASEEQDLSGSAVTRSHATGAVGGPETDDIVHLGPGRRIGRSFATVFSLEAGRLTNGQKARLPVYSEGLHNDTLQTRFIHSQAEFDNFNI